MSSQDERGRIRAAIGQLTARGLLASEDTSDLATVRMDGRSYRYRSQFWMLTGVLESDGRRWRIRLQGKDAERARRRIAEEWISAGAPASWARVEADASVLVLLVRPEMAARA